MSETATNPIRIVVADDHPLIREGFKNLLKKQPAIEIVAEANDGRETITIVEEHRPDILILDIKMPHLNGVDVCRILAPRFPNLGIISFSMFDEEDLIMDMVEAGARGYLLKNIEKEELLRAVKIVHDGGDYHCATVKRRIFQLMRQGRISPSRKEEKQTFTPTEISIVKLLCKELTSKGIADSLKLTRRTVEHYKEKIQEKMGVGTSIGILFYAWKHRLIRPEDVDQSQDAVSR